MKYLIILTLLFLQLQITAQSKEKQILIEKLIDSQGTTKAFQTVLNNMLELQKDQNPFLDQDFWDGLKSEFSKDNFKELKQLLLPIYDKHFSEEQIVDIIKFYESETGKYLVERQSVIINESMDAGSIWGENIGMKIYTEILKSDEFKYKSEIESCDDFKIGKFKTILKDNTELQISRTLDHQIESYNGETYEYKIEWLSPCRYKLINIGKGIDPNESDIIVNIYEVDKNKCQTISKIDGQNYYEKTEVFKDN